jgi:virulence-associated protein VagC
MNVIKTANLVLQGDRRIFAPLIPNWDNLKNVSQQMSQ